MAKKQRFRLILGTAGVLLSLTLSILFSLDAFSNPVLPYASYAGDGIIALIYLVAFVLVVLLFLMKKTGWLIALTSSAVVLIVAPALVNAQTSASIFLLAWFLVVSWMIGDFLFSRIISAKLITKGERLVIAVVLGWGVFVVGMLILGLAGLYQQWAVYTIFIIVTILGVGYYYLKGRKFSELTVHRYNRIQNYLQAPNAHLYALAFAILLIVALGSFLWAMAPAVRYDSLSYHLAVPIRNIAAGRMIEIPESVQTYWAHYGEMLYTLALLLGDQPLPGLINFSAGILLTAQIFFLGVQLKNKTVGILAALIFSSLPIVGIESATTYVEILIGVFVAGVFQAAIFWYREKNDQWLILVGIFSGLAVGTKLTAFWLLLPFLGLLIVYSTSRNGDSPYIHSARNIESKFSFPRFIFWIRRLGKRIITIGLPAIVLFVPWLIRDWLWTGNPIFPNYNNIFHSPQWFDSGFFFIKANVETLRSFFAFPLLGITDSHRYYHEAPGAVLGAVPMLSLPWFYGWHPEMRGKRPNFTLIFLTAVAAIALLFSVAYHARYLLPLYGLLSIFAAANLDILGRMVFAWKKPLGIGLTLLVLTYFYATRLAFTVRWWEIPERYPVKIWLNQESQEQFVDRILPVYGALNFLDRQGAFKVLSIGNELRLYTDSQIYGPYFSKEAYQTLHTASNPNQLAQNLVSGDYDYILVYVPEQNHRPEIYQTPALNSEFFSNYTRLEYARRQALIYRFYPQGIDRSDDIALNLLKNPGFELGYADQWMLMGVSHYVVTEDYFEGQHALMIPGPEASAFQDVPVLPGKIYTASYWAKSTSVGQTIQPYIQWLNADQQPVDKSAHWIEMEPGWNQYQLSTTAPEDAVIARVFISVVNQGQTWFDGLCFLQGDYCP
ncbi:MAG: glycosyltransferase family 39 protein [Chloroflexota bacterium]